MDCLTAAEITAPVTDITLQPKEESQSALPTLASKTMNTSAASLSDLETPAQGSHTTSGTAQPSSPQTKSHESPRAVKLQGSNSGGEQTAVHAHGRKKTPPMRAADGTEIGTDPDFNPVPATESQPAGPVAVCPHPEAGPTGGRTSARGGPSKYRGVVWHKSNSKWEARIYESGKQKFLGYFTVEDEAAMAYDDYAVRLHGAYAKLNFPDRYAGVVSADGSGDRTGAAQIPKTVACKAKSAPRPRQTAAAGPASRRGGFRVQPIKGSSRFRGVSWNSNCGKWRAQVWKGSEVHHLGYFENEEDAARAYDEAVLRIRGPESPTNFPKSDYGVYSDVEGDGPQGAPGQTGAGLPPRPPAASKKPTEARPSRMAASVAVAAAVAAAQGNVLETAFSTGGDGSQFYGVSWDHSQGYWEAEIWDGQRYRKLGAFQTEKDAAREYDVACLEKHGSQALTNFPITHYETELAALALTGVHHNGLRSSAMQNLGAAAAPMPAAQHTGTGSAFHQPKRNTAATATGQNMASAFAPLNGAQPVGQAQGEGACSASLSSNGAVVASGVASMEQEATNGSSPQEDKSIAALHALRQMTEHHQLPAMPAALQQQQAGDPLSNLLGLLKNIAPQLGNGGSPLAAPQPSPPQQQQQPYGGFMPQQQQHSMAHILSQLQQHLQMVEGAMHHQQQQRRFAQLPMHFAANQAMPWAAAPAPQGGYAMQPPASGSVFGGQISNNSNKRGRPQTAEEAVLALVQSYAAKRSCPTPQA